MSSSDPIAYGLPHRAPFVFVDEVREVIPGSAAKCAKVFSETEPFFAGHFPGDPLVPGVILSEALAQTAGIAAGRAETRKSYRLSAIKLMKFLKPVRPHDEVFLEACKIAEIGGLLQFQVTARVGSETVAEGVIVLSEVEHR